MQEFTEQQRQWAETFKEKHNCNYCPFVKDEVDVGVGIIRNCDFTCKMNIEEILQEMSGYSVGM